MDNSQHASSLVYVSLPHCIKQYQHHTLGRKISLKMCSRDRAPKEYIGCQ